MKKSIFSPGWVRTWERGGVLMVGRWDDGTMGRWDDGALGRWGVGALGRRGGAFESEHGRFACFVKRDQPEAGVIACSNRWKSCWCSSVRTRGYTSLCTEARRYWALEGGRWVRGRWLVVVGEGGQWVVGLGGGRRFLCSLL